jgi:UDP-N-acetylmuramate: L-alanyl-gamma-D-glutamyl-meso-diaminopimelate ligase
MRIYFMGICGTAMGNAALLARAAGHEVLGADQGIYPPMSDVLAAAGIAVEAGFDAARLQRAAPDLVVIGNAISRGNPEVEWLLDEGGPAFTSLPAFLHDHILRGRRNLVVAGTHGKTTTTSLAAFLLRAAGRDPGHLIGGVPLDPPTGHHLGTATDPFVIEGDEYDSAFFDKRSKFIHYAPRVAVLNNLEFDHADIFRDLADVQRTFRHFVRLVPRSGWVVMNGDDENLRALGPMPWTQVWKVGTTAENDVRIVDFHEDGAGARFRLLWRGQPWGGVSWSLPGLYNARNAAMAASAVALITRFDDRQPDDLLAPLTRFRGVKRRQEVLLQIPGLTVIEDFGHHPTALAETLRSFRARFPATRLTAVFEPRSNTARTRVLQPAFIEALSLADEVYLGAVNRADKLAESERFDPGAVQAALGACGRRVRTAPTNAQLLQELLRNSVTVPSAPCLVVFFTNGSFDGIIPEFVAARRL